jgi:guanosine-3',5'-bis(diphosphate) 3'-pyrophosphohydrolase
MNRILTATLFAAHKHSTQRRKNAAATPYINHPVEVAFHLASVGGIDDEEILIAALLHDTIEDTETTRDEIANQFGECVAGLVCECTDDKSLPKAERKRLQVENAPHKSPSAKMIKIADKICNLRSILTDPPVDWSIDRQYDYFIWAEKVIAGLTGVNQKLDKAAEGVILEGKQKFSRV